MLFPSLEHRVEFGDSCNLATKKSRRSSLGIRCHRRHPAGGLLGAAVCKNEWPLFSSHRATKCKIDCPRYFKSEQFCTDSLFELRKQNGSKHQSQHSSSAKRWRISKRSGSQIRNTCGRQMLEYNHRLSARERQANGRIQSAVAKCTIIPALL